MATNWKEILGKAMMVLGSGMSGNSNTATAFLQMAAAKKERERKVQEKFTQDFLNTMKMLPGKTRNIALDELAKNYQATTGHLPSKNVMKVITGLDEEDTANLTAAIEGMKKGNQLDFDVVRRLVEGQGGVNDMLNIQKTIDLGRQYKQRAAADKLANQVTQAEQGTGAALSAASGGTSSPIDKAKNKIVILDNAIPRMMELGNWKAVQVLEAQKKQLSTMLKPQKKMAGMRDITVEGTKYPVMIYQDGSYDVLYGIGSRSIKLDKLQTAILFSGYDDKVFNPSSLTPEERKKVEEKYKSLRSDPFGGLFGGGVTPEKVGEELKDKPGIISRTLGGIKRAITGSPSTDNSAKKEFETTRQKLRGEGLTLTPKRP